MKVITIEIINEKVLRLFQELEALKLIKLRKMDSIPSANSLDLVKFKGRMSPQSKEHVEKQLNQLRSSWE